MLFYNTLNRVSTLEFKKFSDFYNFSTTFLDDIYTSVYQISRAHSIFRYYHDFW